MKQIKKLKLERDVWEGTVEIIKKDPGADPKNLKNREKAILIDALRKEHPRKNLLDCVSMKRSSFFYHCSRGLTKDKYSTLKSRIIDQFEANRRCYGYRRIHALLVRDGIYVSEKVVRRLMAECSLIVFGKSKRKYSSYRGENAPSAENIIKRNFHADTPNTKWLTDITEFHIPSGKVYLSPIMDCFDGMLVSWTISTHPDSELVNTVLDLATASLRADEHPAVNSERGSHYRGSGWIARMEKAGLSNYMSKKGCSPDNASCEGLFGRLKNEMFL
ncbi:MAG: IS3 family transposase [Synergistaceae bacterium]|nr:IS3 family transposase [Synergistaceae bacterium]